MTASFLKFMSSACSSSHVKNDISLIKATLMASAIPERQSRSINVVKKSTSLKTATAGANVPRKFFLPR